MASATLFLALQCVQCATMQVKQQKKSSNKWVCTVCNQRQSVMRVHARGHRAADLRRFVQDANMSRGRREYAPLAEAVAAEEERDEAPREERRMDWSEYLDDPGEQRDGLGGVDGEMDTGIEVTTEPPQERPKIRPRNAQMGVAGKRSKPSTNPTLSKRQRIEQVSSPCPATATAEAQRSKWSKYLDPSFFGERNGSESSGQHWTETDQYVTTEVVVDDDVHPDFI
uniref:MRN complex-interacting protein N-terminal domain-containing protein n=1 Tax=Arundo donax TaxID=35708 RepID=A0A0A9EYU7_ARUDO